MSLLIEGRPRRPPLRSSSFDVSAEIRRWRDDGDTAARLRVFDEFLPLARRLSTRYRNPYESSEDLAQVAAVGLLGGIDRFDPDRGARFESYVIPTILGELKRYFRDKGWSVHVPRRAKELALAVDHGIDEFVERTGRSPGVDELAASLSLEVEDVLIGLDAGMAHFSGSLDAPLPGARSEDSATVGDLLGSADAGFDLVDTKLSFVTAIAQLPHRERLALRLRLEGDLRQSDIARQMGCSQMQVSRLLRRAADGLRELLDPKLGPDARLPARGAGLD